MDWVVAEDKVTGRYQACSSLTAFYSRLKIVESGFEAASQAVVRAAKLNQEKSSGKEPDDFYLVIHIRMVFAYYCYFV